MSYSQHYGSFDTKGAISPSTVTAVLATGHGQSEDPQFSLLGDGSHVQYHDLNPLWWNGCSVVRPHHQSITCQFQKELNELNLNKKKKKKDYCQLFTHKKIELKNSPSLGMNAPDQLNSFHRTSYTTYSELLKTQNIKKENLEENIRRFTWTEQHLHEKNHHIENKSLLTAIKRKRGKKKKISVAHWHGVFRHEK